MTEQERYLLKYITPLSDEELNEIPAMLMKAIAENSGSFGNMALVAQLWKRIVHPPQGVLEETATAILDMWDMREIEVLNPLKHGEVTRKFIAFRDALRDVRVERFNQQLSVKEHRNVS